MLKHSPDYIGHYNDKECWMSGSPLPLEGVYPVTICAAKCTRWWVMMFEDRRDGLCHFCHLEQFEGEPDLK